MPESETPSQTTYYDLLGVRPTASPQQIRRAYRDLSKLYHPDTTTLPAAIATKKFQQLNEAYGALSNPEARLAYDRDIGYSRIAVIQTPANFNQSVRSQRESPSNAYLDPTDRPLSPGEIFALFILGLTFAACLALVVTVGFSRGEIVLGLHKELPASSIPDISVPIQAEIAPPNENGQPSPDQDFSEPPLPLLRLAPTTPEAMTTGPTQAPALD